MMPAPLWGIMPLENKMHSQCKFVLNIGFGRSSSRVFEVGFEKSDSKIARRYQLALFAAVANSKIFVQKNNRPLQVELENGRS